MERAKRRDPLSAAALSRLAFALMFSLALHAVLLVRVEQGPRQPESRAIVHARLITDMAKRPVPAIVERRTLPVPDGAAAPVPPPAATTDAGRAQLAATDRDAPVPSQQAAALRLPQDLNYYPAAELDVYPLPVQAIAPDLDAVRGGWIRVLTSIGETGQVDDAVVFDADPAGMFDGPALSAIRGARFYPARRNGRDVRSRVLIELHVPDAAFGGES